MQGGFSKAYKSKGVAGYYQQTGNKYSNPHSYDIQRLLRKKLGKPNEFLKPQYKILDMACGGGQATKPLFSFGYKNIKGTDPYTAQAYKKNTNLECDEYSFMDILQGCYDGQKFDCIICSYAMHLIKQSLLHDFCNKLTEISDRLIIVAPHKFPLMKQTFGWKEAYVTIQDKIYFRFFEAIKDQENKQSEQGKQGLQSLVKVKQKSEQQIKKQPKHSKE